MNDLLKETVEEYNSYLQKIQEAALLIAQKLRIDAENEAMSMIANFSEGMLWMLEVKRALLQYEIVVDLNEESVMTYLLDITNSLEQKDYVLVADLFEYEVAPFFANSSAISVTN